jgi:hypothetical protein
MNRTTPFAEVVKRLGELEGIGQQVATASIQLAKEIAKKDASMQTEAEKNFIAAHARLLLANM